MEIYRATLETCDSARGTVIVIDVLRAFTTAAFAFAAGAVDVTLVGTVEEALALRAQTPQALVMGEVDGLPVKEFDLTNSPSDLLDRDLSGHHMIQRTTAGTQGVVRSVLADNLLAASLVCAGATIRYIQKLAPAEVTLVITGIFADGRGDEDIACADYLESLLRGQPLDPAEIIRRVRESITARQFNGEPGTVFPAQDVVCAIDLDRFDFALPIERRNGRLVMQPQPAG